MNQDSIRRALPLVGVWLAMAWVSPGAALAVAALGAGLLAKTRDRFQTIVLSAFSYPAGVWLIDHPGALWVLAAALLGAVAYWLARAGRFRESEALAKTNPK